MSPASGRPSPPAGGPIGAGPASCSCATPTTRPGRVFDDGELAALAEVAVDADLTVISDEIHADLVFPGVRHRPFASLGPEVAARTVTLTSATKSFSIAGLRLALAHFGSSDLQERYASIPRFLLGGANSAGVAATLAAWREGDDWIDELVRYLDGNRQLVARTVDERLPGVSHRSPEATYLAWLDCRRAGRRGPGPQPGPVLPRPGRGRAQRRRRLRPPRGGLRPTQLRHLPGHARNGYSTRWPPPWPTPPVRS